MIKALTNGQMRRADEYTINTGGVPSETLMRRAGLAICKEVQKTAERLGVRDVLVVCGTGNNGGDGYVCATELLKLGYDVKIFAAEGNLSPDCAREKERYNGAYSRHICGSIIVDCIFGTGLCRSVTGKYAEIIGAINASDAYVISTDIPSGINGDSGEVLGVAVKADKNVAVAEYKAGMFLCDGIDYCGELVKADIGIACPEDNYMRIFEDGDIKRFFPARRRNSHKGTYGCANLVTGSDKYIGVAALGVGACLKSGCGYTKLTSSEKVKTALVASMPQAIFTDKIDLSADCIAIGSGSGVSEELYDTLKELLSSYSGTLIIDADGLNALAEYGCEVLKNAKCDVVLTPHVKEFSRLSGLEIAEIRANPVGVAEEFAQKYGVTVLLKNAVSVITDGEKTVLNVTGNTALSKGGSGDMLAGFMCGTAARGVSAFDAAVCSAFVIGRAAELAAERVTEYCATADDIINCIHLVVKGLTS